MSSQLQFERQGSHGISRATISVSGRRASIQKWAPGGQRTLFREGMQSDAAAWVSELARNGWVLVSDE